MEALRNDVRRLRRALKVIIRKVQKLDEERIRIYELLIRYAAASAQQSLPITIHNQSASAKKSKKRKPRSPESPSRNGDGARHSADFRSVHWHGKLYSFTASQAACVRVLWEAWKNGTPEIGQETLLEAAGSEGNKLGSLFQDSPSWGTLIVPGACRGSFRLAEPE